MSTLKTNNVQVGQSVTATNNFTLYQPATPDGTVRLGVGNTGATTADVITANSSGNVGIGTSSPQHKLHVVGTSSQVASFIRDNTGNASGGINIGNNSRVWTIYGDNSSLSTYDTTAGLERMRIDSSGNLLVNTTSQNDSSQFSVTVASGRNGIGISVGSTAETGQIIFRNPNGVVGRVYTSGSSTTFATSSDYRLKEDIAPMTGALAKVAALKPVTYKWKVDGTEGQGFIAHELQAVVPECVSGKKDEVDADGSPVYQGIDTSFLVATLTAAIQELKAELDSVKSELATLKNG